jgi:trimethylamine--corrinoid protein Co-methyltransferase
MVSLTEGRHGGEWVTSAQLRIWDAEACQRVHEATLTVLEECGVQMHHGTAREILQGAGARVDGSRVRIGSDIVEKALASVPRHWTLPSRGQRPDVELSEGNTYFGTGPDCLYVRDPITGLRRRALLGDVERMAALAQRLPSIDFVMSMSLPADVDQTVVDLAQFAAMLGGTDKPIVASSPHGGASLRVMHEMAALCGDAGNFGCLAMSSPPLKHDEETLDKLLVCAELSIPLVLACAPNCGVTAPSSIAAAIVVGNAEILSGLVLHQTASPGAPFVYGAGVGAMNMSTALDIYCPPETLLGDQATCDLCRFYGLPSWSYAAVSDSKLLDEQLSLEYGVTTVLGALSRATLLHDVGYLESGLQSAYETMVLGDEIVSYARWLLRGVPVDDEALAVGEIIAVGPGGNHLTRRYTRAHHRDVWRTTLLDHSVHGRWQAAGSSTLADRVHARTEALLAEPPAFMLDEDLSRELAEIAAAGCRR